MTYNHRRRKVLSINLAEPPSHLEVVEVDVWQEEDYTPHGEEDRLMFRCTCGWEMEAVVGKCDGCERIFIAGRRKKLQELALKFPPSKSKKVHVSERRILIDE